MANDSHLLPSTSLVAVSGATGLIGGALVETLRARGVRVRRLVRALRGDSPDDVVWDPMHATLSPDALDGVDAVVHLAGEPIAQRWTHDRKQAIRESRVRGTEQLAHTIARMARKPSVLLSGSAVGYYGDRGNELLDEQSAAGTDFLASVVREEAEAWLQGEACRVHHGQWVIRSLKPWKRA
jgi:NAD dependent epimerase/dehydratase family enzyme